MPKAEVTLKEGASYTLRGHVFTAKPSMITSEEDIAAARAVPMLFVRDIPDEPASAPKKKAAKKDEPAVEAAPAEPVAPAPEPAPESETPVETPARRRTR